MKNPRQWIELRTSIHIFYQSWSKRHLKRYKPIYQSLASVHESSRQIVKNTNKSWVRLKRSCKRTIALFFAIVLVKKLVEKAKKLRMTYYVIRVVFFVLFFGIRRKENKSEGRNKKIIGDLKL